MSADANVPAKAFDGVSFDDFYDRALPVVYGYLLRLCGGDRDEAWDLTQDSWLTVIDQLARGQTDNATVGFLLSVARSRYIDSWRRQRTLQRELR
jgi:RNA polymerase sigma-70 factor (ECF subfamily)